MIAHSPQPISFRDLAEIRDALSNLCAMNRVSIFPRAPHSAPIQVVARLDQIPTNAVPFPKMDWSESPQGLRPANAWEIPR